jgi:hypothetical protein
MIKNQIIDFHLISFSTMEFQNKTLLQFWKKNYENLQKLQNLRKSTKITFEP